MHFAPLEEGLNLHEVPIAKRGTTLSTGVLLHNPLALNREVLC